MKASVNTRAAFLAWFLALEAAVCVLGALLQGSAAVAFSSAIAFPFEQIGLLLRRLSLSGRFGNAAALALYAVICLLPCLSPLAALKKRTLQAEDALPVLLAAVLFAVLYLMINPSLLSNVPDIAAGGKAMLGATVYSVICGWAVLRILRLSAGGVDALARYIAGMLVLFAALFVYVAFGACFAGLLRSIDALRAGSTGGDHLIGYAFLVLRHCIDALPYLLDVAVVFALLRLLAAWRNDHYAQETIDAARRASRLCAAALCVTVLTNAAFNILQLLFAKSLMSVSAAVQIPVFSIAFALAILLLTRLLIENKRLKDDNDMFI